MSTPTDSPQPTFEVVLDEVVTAQLSLVNARIAVPVNPAMAANVAPDGTIAPQEPVPGR